VRKDQGRRSGRGGALGTGTLCLEKSWGSIREGRKITPKRPVGGGRSIRNGRNLRSLSEKKGASQRVGLLRNEGTLERKRVDIKVVNFRRARKILSRKW